jgi:hypothetical protein
MSRRRFNKISGQFSSHLVEMQESPAFRALSLSGHRLLARLDIELAHHGGNDNGKLPVTYEDFIAYGMDRDSVAPAIREAEALGFIRVTERGRGGNAEFRQPSKYFITYAHARTATSPPPSNDWRKHKTVEEAQAAARAARLNKDSRAVAFGLRRAKNKNRSGEPRPKPIGKTPTETTKVPVGKTPTTVSVGKPRLLSISRVGGEAARPDLPLSAPLPTHAQLLPKASSELLATKIIRPVDPFAVDDDLTIPDFLDRRREVAR